MALDGQRRYTAGMAKTKPHRRHERHWRATGKKLIAGVDEAGKGAWAGPLVAGAVILGETFEPKMVNDSKVLTKRQRERMFVHVTRNAISWAVAVILPAEIDRLGMTKANHRALEQAVRRLHIRPQAVLVDAVPLKLGRTPVQAVINGDALNLSIAAASIVAKVVRDALMDGEHRQWPIYGFAFHKGYGTAAHQRALRRHGASPIHRQSFAPLRRLKASPPRRRRPVVKRKKR